MVDHSCREMALVELKDPPISQLRVPVARGKEHIRRTAIARMINFGDYRWPTLQGAFYVRAVF